MNTTCKIMLHSELSFRAFIISLGDEERLFFPSEQQYICGSNSQKDRALCLFPIMVSTGVLVCFHSFTRLLWFIGINSSIPKAIVFSGLWEDV